MNTIAFIRKAIQAIALFIVCANSPATTASEWELLPSRANDVELSVTDSVIDIRTTGQDPFLVGRLVGGRSAEHRVLEFEYFCTQGINNFSCYFGPPISETSRVDLPDLPIAEGWQRYKVDLREWMQHPLSDSTELLRFDFGTTADVRLQIRGARLRALTEQEQIDIVTRQERRGQKIDEAKRIADYLSESYPHELDVRIDDQAVTVSLKLPGDDPATYQLIEYLPEHSIGAPKSGTACDDAKIAIVGKRLTFQLPRHVNRRDRLHSAWRIRSLDTGAFLTARRFVTSSTVSPGHAEDRLQPNSQKGLSGFSPRGPKQDLLDLGIHAVTVNLVLNRFVSDSPGVNREQIDVPGPPVYFDSSAFAGYDRLIDYARQHEIVVTAIVLITRGKPMPRDSPLVHPESDGGTYAMPDLTSERGVAIYSRVLEAVAKRYRDTDESPGGITNWIAHNEIDFHPVWTNMGPQPRELVTETYYRSMRIIHNAARSHNPHARVFASLTHHWVVPDDGKWRQLAPREVLESLQRYSEMEGDFAWGVAYHPYPQSLFAKVAWNDTDITDNFDTPLITMQNLEVLGRFLQQPTMRASDGNMRPVILSEQGYHTDTYDDDSQARQAGSLAYAMNKVRQSPWIESFYYHRWIDHPNEGGLMLGLRTLPTRDDRDGTRKRSWHVYQAIGTDRESKVTDGLPKP